MRIELYKFVRDAETWTFTSSDTAVVYETETYTPLVIGHSDRCSKGEISKENLNITIDVFNSFAEDVTEYFGDEPLTLTLYVQIDSTTTIGWKGRYVGQKISGSIMTLIMESTFTTLKQPGLRARYQKNCRHVLYGDNCGVIQLNYSDVGPVTDIDDRVLRVPIAADEDDGYYTGGIVEDADSNKRWIIEHEGEYLTLSRRFEALENSDSDPLNVILYPGCNHTPSDCQGKFSNILNYGGFPWIPVTDPLTGSQII